MRLGFFAAAVAACLLSGCGQASPFFRCPHPEFSDGDYRRAALDAVGPINDTAQSQADIARVDGEVAKLRPWAAKIEDVCMRDHVNDWLDFFGHQVRESWSLEQSYAAGKDQRDEREIAENHRRRELLAKTAFPPKPTD